MLIVGDSHSEAMFSGRRNDVTLADSTILGAHRTAFKLQDHDDVVRKVLGNTKDQILFIFGEIDCRFHIMPKAKENGTHILQEINLVAKRYINYVHKLRNDGYNISVLSIEPQSRNKGEETTSYEDRVMIVESMNYAYARYCRYLNVPFFDIYLDLVTIDGFRKPDLVKDKTHLGIGAGYIFLQKGFKW